MVCICKMLFMKAYSKYEKIKGESVSWQLIKRMYSLLGPHKKEFYGSALLACVLAFLAPLRPALIQKAIDDYIFKFDERGLIVICVVIIFLLIIESVGRYGFIYLTN